MTCYKVHTICFTKTSKKQFDSLKKTIKQEIAKILDDEIAKGPLVGKSLQGPLNVLRSYRIGKLRVIYQQNKKEILILEVRIEHRKQVYK